MTQKLNLRTPNAYAGAKATQHKMGTMRFATDAEALAGTAKDVALTPGQSTSSVPDATTTVKGKVALSTNAQAVTGTDPTHAVVPSALTARLAAPGAIGGTTPGAGTFAGLTSTTTITGTLGDITATNGNFVGSAAGKGFKFNANTASGAAASPLVLNSRAGMAVFTSVSIAAAADLTLTITNSEITGSSTQVLYSLQGCTTGGALTIKSVTNSAGSSAIVVTNGTGATTSTADIHLVFCVLN